jgi:hypothetical protein
MNDISLINSLVTTIAVILAVIGGLYFLMLYRKDKRIEAHRLDEERMRSREWERRTMEENKIKKEQLFNERERYEYQQKKLNDQLLEKFKKEVEQELTGLSAGGYIILDLPDNLRSMFHDLLKGFEDYAKLKGYEIIFSIDNSLQNKIAFKFTLQNDGVNVSTQTVRQDIKEYIEKVKSGSNFDDLPVIISPAEHELVSTTLKNRLNFLHHNYTLEKNTREHYENLCKKLSASPNGVSQHPSIYIQTGGVNTPKSLSANNSPNILMGDNNLYENNIDNSDHSVITITNSFNKKKEQIEKLDEVIRLLTEEKNLDGNIKQNLVTNFDKIKEELADEEEPSKSKIFKWLSNTKKVLENVVLSHHTTEAIHWIYDNFNFIVHKISSGT